MYGSTRPARLSEAHEPCLSQAPWPLCTDPHAPAGAEVRPTGPGLLPLHGDRSARKAGLRRRVHLHGFRHTHAVELVRDGAPRPEVRAQLGHSSLAVTGRDAGGPRRQGAGAPPGAAEGGRVAANAPACHPTAHSSAPWRPPRGTLRSVGEQVGASAATATARAPLCERFRAALASPSDVRKTSPSGRQPPRRNPAKLRHLTRRAHSRQGVRKSVVWCTRALHHGR